MATTTYVRIKCYVGPVHVDDYAKLAKQAGLTDVEAGTEHVYGTVATEPLVTETDRLVLRHRAAAMVYGASMATGWRDVEILGVC